MFGKLKSVAVICLGLQTAVFAADSKPVKEPGATAVEHKSMQALLAAPGAQRVFDTRVFNEPLAPVDITTPGENADLVALLEAAVNSKSSQPILNLNHWADRNNNSPWAIGLYYNLGTHWFQAGYFTKAENAWRKGWDIGKDRTDLNAKRLADLCFGELVRMHSRLGRIEELAAAFKEIKGREITAPASNLVEHQNK